MPTIRSLGQWATGDGDRVATLGTRSASARTAPRLTLDVRSLRFAFEWGLHGLSPRGQSAAASRPFHEIFADTPISPNSRLADRGLIAGSPQIRRSVQVGAATSSGVRAISSICPGPTRPSLSRRPCGMMKEAGSCARSPTTSRSGAADPRGLKTCKRSRRRADGHVTLCFSANQAMLAAGGASSSRRSRSHTTSAIRDGIMRH